MAWHINLDQSRKFIRISYPGTITPSDLMEAFAAAVKLSHETGILRFYADCTEMTGGHSIIDLFNLISQYMSSGVPHTFREAVVIPSGQIHSEDVKFYETACLNRGYTVRVFTDSQEAIKWLTSGQV
jgi:hypothetical protein